MIDLHIHRSAAKPSLKLTEWLNVLRAGVLGMNDGIISTAGIVLGVAGAQQSSFALFIAGISGLIAGAFSMGGGEFVSVSQQRDMQKTAAQKQRQAIADHYPEELADLTQVYLDKGISPALAQQVATELMLKDGLGATCQEKYNIELGNYFNPWHAALSSFLSFSAGAVLPLLTITLVPVRWKVQVTVIAVALALILTGYSSATLGHTNRTKAVLRNLLVGLLTMIVTYAMGHLFVI
ncbi:VIT1/CCC1 transporter family protein [Loigolactobacillus binensis]|uniref:VIT family protein n=1 Tax=Loigolactobacillus binensis TaxID=2559922 RepID=A0ABW3E788_9LACO|nr:VIT family protein [Loigolactobacillus binensis]